MKAINILNLHKVVWERMDADHVKISYIGCIDENWNIVENELVNSGMRAVKRTYDKKNNKTHTIYKKVG